MSRSKAVEASCIGATCGIERQLRLAPCVVRNPPEPECNSQFHAKQTFHRIRRLMMLSTQQALTDRPPRDSSGDVQPLLGCRWYLPSIGFEGCRFDFENHRLCCLGFHVSRRRVLDRKAVRSSRSNSA